MKKLTLLLLLISCTAFAQEKFEFSKYTATGIFDVENKSEEEIYSLLNRWISLNYNSAQNVIQLNDKEAGNIIVKGINTVQYKNVSKKLDPDNDLISDYSEVKYNHTIEFNIKNGKYRVIYTLTDIVSPGQIAGFNVDDLYSIIYECTDFTGVKQEGVNLYNSYIEGMYKNTFVSKKKREKILSMTEPALNEINNSVKKDVENTFDDIHKSVNSKSKDDW